MANCSWLSTRQQARQKPESILSLKEANRWEQAGAGAHGEEEGDDDAPAPAATRGSADNAGSAPGPELALKAGRGGGPPGRWSSRGPLRRRRRRRRSRRPRRHLPNKSRIVSIYTHPSPYEDLARAPKRGFPGSCV